jgi:biopolymer transport protein ExbD
MAGGIDLGSPMRGGRKPLDTVINLVPFIDLMAVTVAFLIMTAVWTQLGRLPVASSGGDAVAVTERLPLTLHLDRYGAMLTIGDEHWHYTDLERLTAALLRLDAESVDIRADDDVSYDALVQAVDACLAARITGVTVTP